MLRVSERKIDLLMENVSQTTRSGRSMPAYTREKNFFH